MRDLIKNARLHFGSAPTVYRSMARDQMESQLIDEESMEEQREKNRMLKVSLSDEFPFTVMLCGGWRQSNNKCYEGWGALWGWG